MRQTGRFISKLFWLLMALQVLWVGSEFSGFLEEEPVSGYTLSEIKIPASSYLKKIRTLPGIPEKMTQEETVEYPDYVPLGLNGRASLPRHARISSDRIIPFEESNLSPFCPDLHSPPPESRFS